MYRDTAIISLTYDSFIENDVLFVWDKFELKLLSWIKLRIYVTTPRIEQL